MKRDPVLHAWLLQKACERFGYQSVPERYYDRLGKVNLQHEIFGLKELLEWCRAQPVDQAQAAVRGSYL